MDILKEIRNRFTELSKKNSVNCDEEFDVLRTPDGQPLHNYQHKILRFNNSKITTYLNLITDLINTITKEACNFQKSKLISLVSELYNMTETSITEITQYKSCTIGCAACCRFLVETTAIEAEYTRQYIDSHFDSKTKYWLTKKIIQVAKQQPRQMNFLSEFDRENYYSKFIACPFLTDNNTCSIYQVRPFLCRTCFVFTDPQNCLPGGDIIGYTGDILVTASDALFNLSTITFPKLVVTDNTPLTRPLPVWFINDFDRINHD